MSWSAPPGDERRAGGVTSKAVECIDYDDLDEQREIFDAEVRVSPHVDGFCASTDWILPAARGLEAGRRPWIWRGTHGWVALSIHQDPQGARVGLENDSCMCVWRAPWRGSESTRAIGGTCHNRPYVGLMQRGLSRGSPSPTRMS